MDEPSWVPVPTPVARGVESDQKRDVMQVWAAESCWEAGTQGDPWGFEELGDHDMRCGIYSLVFLSDISDEINFIYFVNLHNFAKVLSLPGRDPGGSAGHQPTEEALPAQPTPQPSTCITCGSPHP